MSSPTSRASQLNALRASSNSSTFGVTMSFFDKLADNIEARQRELWRERYPFLAREPKGLGYQWVVKQKADGCRPVEAQVSISMEKSPRPISSYSLKSGSASSENKTASDVPAVKEVNDITQKMVAAAVELAKLESKKAKEEDCPQPPPFDMLDLPEGMKAMGFKYAAYCADRWFKGEAHQIPNKSSEIQPNSFVDTDTFKLDWILKFGRVRKRYAHLLATDMDAGAEMNIYSARARNELLKKLRVFNAMHGNIYSGTFDAMEACAGDIQALHQRFQFQFVEVTAFDVLNGVAMNDLAASLANFGIYAAIARANVKTDRYMSYGQNPWLSCTHSKVQITHIYVYVRDVYSFNDDPQSTVSQYLGHWNKHGVIVALDAISSEGLSSWSKYLEHESGNEPRRYLPPAPANLDKPVDTGRKLKARAVFYPVRNRHFQQWRDIKRRGGDFVIYSNPELVKLPSPIILDLGEICREYKR